MGTIAQNQISVVRLRDGKDFGLWKQSGGWERNAEGTFARDAYGQPRKALGGQANHERVTAVRTFYAGDTLPDELEAGVGFETFGITRQKLDAQGFAVGKPVYREGPLMAFSRSDVDVDGQGTDEYTCGWDVDG